MTDISNYFVNCETISDYKKAIRIYLIANYNHIEHLRDILSIENIDIANEYINLFVRILASYHPDSLSFVNNSHDLRYKNTWLKAIETMESSNNSLENKIRTLRDCFKNRVYRVYFDAEYERQINIIEEHFS